MFLSQIFWQNLLSNRKLNITFVEIFINNSSGNTSKINFAGGTLDVFVTMPAAKTVYLDASGNPVGAASNGFALAMAVAL